MENVEVDQQTYPHPAQTQVGEELGLVNWVEGVDGLHFYYDPVLYYQVHTISELELVAVIDYRQAY